MQPNGDEFVSEYGDGYQRAYVIPKGQLDYWKSQASDLSSEPPTSKQASSPRPSLAEGESR